MPNLWNHIPPPTLGPLSCPAPQLPEASVSRTLISVSSAWWARHAFRGPPPASLLSHGGNCPGGSCGSFPELPSLGTAVSRGWLSRSGQELPQTYCPDMWPSLGGGRSARCRVHQQSWKQNLPRVFKIDSLDVIENSKPKTDTPGQVRRSSPRGARGTGGRVAGAWLQEGIRQERGSPKLRKSQAQCCHTGGVSQQGPHLRDHQSGVG